MDAGHPLVQYVKLVPFAPGTEVGRGGGWYGTGVPAKTAQARNRTDLSSIRILIFYIMLLDECGPVAHSRRASRSTPTNFHVDIETRTYSDNLFSDMFGRLWIYLTNHNMIQCLIHVRPVRIIG